MTELNSITSTEINQNNLSFFTQFSTSLVEFYNNYSKIVELELKDIQIIYFERKMTSNA